MWRLYSREKIYQKKYIEPFFSLEIEKSFTAVWLMYQVHLRETWEVEIHFWG